MKNCKLLISISLVLSLTVSAFAQSDDSKSAYRAGLSFFYPFSANITSHFGVGANFKMGYDYNFYKSLSATVNFGAGVFSAENPAWDQYIYHFPLNFNASYKVLNGTNYSFDFFAGPGYYTSFGIGDERNSSYGVNAGGRFNWKLNDYRELQFELAGHEWMEELYWVGTSDFIEFSITISSPDMATLFQKKKKTITPRTPDQIKAEVVSKPQLTSEKDADGDGVPNIIDKSPGTPAGVTVDEFGRPLDGDKDRIPDHIDLGKNTPMGIRVDTRGRPLDADNDGIPDFRDRSPATPTNVKVDQFGRPLDTDSDGVPDYQDAEKNSPANSIVDPKGKTIISYQARVIEGIEFQLGKTEFKDGSYSALTGLFTALYANSQLKIELHGYTDSKGDPQVNKNISLKRVNKVRDYLIENGISPARITTRGFGAANFLVKDTAAPQNRRVEAVIKR
ncbi:MAG: OmpA family protein [FCB group bacterium]|nr:OmpA family protein [FCB group bacterium]